MNKPNGYDEVKASGEFTPVELGGHKLVIKQVTEKKSEKGNDMIVVLFDFAKGDAQEGYFMESFQSDIRPDKKWSNQATKYIMVNDYEDASKTSKSFKTFCSCVEKSNTGFTTQWGIENWGAQFKGKMIGGVFGEELDFYNGEEKKKRVLRWFVSLDKVADADVPAVSESKAYKEHIESMNKVNNDTDFMSIPNIGSIPFD